MSEIESIFVCSHSRHWKIGSSVIEETVSTLFAFQARVDVATSEFRDHGVSDFVTARQRDVCANGFSDGELDGKADAVFLDLPHPWEAVPHAKKAIRKDRGGR